jgi:hypothetical protein
VLSCSTPFCRAAPSSTTLDFPCARQRPHRPQAGGVHGSSPRATCGHAHRWFRPDPSVGGRKIGESDLLLGPHEQSIGSIARGTPMPPMVPMLHGPGGRTKSPPQRHAPSTHLASEGVTGIVEPPRPQRWLLLPQRTSQKGPYAHPKPRLNKETNAIVVSSRKLASNACSPLCPHRTIPSNKIDRGGGKHACLDALR